MTVVCSAAISQEIEAVNKHEMPNKAHQSQPSIAGTSKPALLFGMASPFDAKKEYRFGCPCVRR